MSKFKWSDTEPCNLARLLETRLLVQANSGAGKSWALRRLLEQTHGQVQHIVLDAEGEFSTLRERYDYVLGAPRGGDTAVDPRTAGLLAERLLDLRVSAILDLYELRAHERTAFVKRFLDAMVNAPKALWHPVLVVVDEAHVFCPEKDKAESTGAVIDLCTRGRKRGFCAVLATQRLAKLHKDAAAECNNVLVGRCALDVDLRRAADLLGLAAKADQQALRAIPPGTFYAVGPAFAQHARHIIEIGPVATTHPRAGGRIAFTPPPPTDKVRAALAKLADLPAEAEGRERTMDDLQREVTTLRRELTAAKKSQPVAPPPAEPIRVEVPVLTEDERMALDGLQLAVDGVRTTLTGATTALQLATQGLAELRSTVAGRARPSAPARTPVQRSAPERTVVERRAPAGNGTHPSGDYAGRICTMIATLDARGIPANASTIAGWLRVHRKNGTLGATLADLRSGGRLDGWRLVDPAAPLPSGLDTLRELLEPYERQIVDLIATAPQASTSALADTLGVHRKNGTLAAALAQLRKMHVIPAGGRIELTEAAHR